VWTGEKEGAAAGKFRVLVQCRKAPPASGPERLVLQPSLIPEKYANENTSPLTVEVKPETNDYPVDLE
jgi:hypothetical protein